MEGARSTAGEEGLCEPTGYNRGHADLSDFLWRPEKENWPRVEETSSQVTSET